MWPTAASAAADCLLNQSIGVFVAHTFTDSGGVVRQGTNYGPIYSQLSSRLSGQVGAVMEIGASSGKEALTKTEDRAGLLAFFELNGRASDIPLPGGQRTSIQDVRMQASLRIIDVANRRLLGAATDMVSAAGLSIEATLPTILPGVINRVSDIALAQACAQPGLLPFSTIQVAEERDSRSTPLSEEQLDLIASFADRFCKEVPLEGDKKQIELSGQAEAELTNILTKMAGINIGGSGEASVNLNEYTGFVQNELLDAFKTNYECRLVIWNDLKERTP